VADEAIKSELRTNNGPVGEHVRKQGSGYAARQVRRAHKKAGDRPAEAEEKAQTQEADTIENRLSRTFTERYTGRAIYEDVGKGEGNWWHCDAVGIWEPDLNHWTVHEMKRLSEELAADERGAARRERMTQWKTLQSALRLVAVERSMCIKPSRWSDSPDCVGTPEGVLDLSSGELRPAEPQEYFNRSVAVAPAKQADCPQFRDFILKLAGNDQQLRDFILRLCGRALRFKREQHLAYWWGQGSNGKTTLAELIRRLAGDYAVSSEPSNFTARYEAARGGHDTEMAELRGARLVVSSEVRAKAVWDTARLKKMLGGDEITARVAYGRSSQKFVPGFDVWMYGQELPDLGKVDEAVRRRIYIIPCRWQLLRPDMREAERERIVAEMKALGLEAQYRDLKLPESLWAEAPAILRLLVEHSVDELRNGLRPPQKVLDLTEGYYESQENSSFDEWVAECVVRAEPEIGRKGETGQKLRDNCAAWHKRNGHNDFVLLEKVFAAEMKERGFLPGRGGHGGRVYLGAWLKGDQYAF
jgi:putative DNA primase/helicase